jgi:hypothetical protein
MSIGWTNAHYHDSTRAMVDVVVRVGQEPPSVVFENREIKAIIRSVHGQIE